MIRTLALALGLALIAVSPSHAHPHHHHHKHASVGRAAAHSMLPRPRPDLEFLHPDRYPRIAPQQGAALAKEVFTTPQQYIDAAFSELGR